MHFSLTELCAMTIADSIIRSGDVEMLHKDIRDTMPDELYWLCVSYYEARRAQLIEERTLERLAS